ncbi:MAG: hypothetical protein P4M11_15500 [Candidatus Pacebacteria bacterium]|nr:hypothetical protein [Candidatus Paceibacterota bacterium]
MDGPLVTPAETSQSRSSKGKLKYWLVMVLISIGTTVTVLIVLTCTYAASLHWRSTKIGNLQLAINASVKAKHDLTISLATLKKGLKYEACLNSHACGIREGFITDIMKREGGAGYVASSWVNKTQESYVHFLSPTLDNQKTCHVSHTKEIDNDWKSHKFFRAAANEAFFYSFPNLYRVKSDCHTESIDLKNDFLSGVVGTGVEGEYLLVCGYGVVHVALLKPDFKLGWDIMFGERDFYIYISDSQLIRLHDGRFAFSFYYDIKQEQDANLSAKAEALFKAEPITAGKAAGCACYGTIQLPADHHDVKHVVSKTNCSTGIYHGFAITESASNTILALGIRGFDITISELDEGLNVVNNRIVYYNNTKFFFRNYGSAYRISDSKYAFSLIVTKADNYTWANTFIYDYNKNEITKSVSLNDTSCYNTPMMSTELSRNYDGSGILAMSVRDSYALISVNSNATDIKQGNHKGFWHMAAIGNGGYVVNRNDNEGVWTFYPWQDEKARLNCTEFM